MWIHLFMLMEKKSNNVSSSSNTQFDNLMFEERRSIYSQAIQLEFLKFEGDEPHG